MSGVCRRGCRPIGAILVFRCHCRVVVVVVYAFFKVLCLVWMMSGVCRRGCRSIGAMLALRCRCRVVVVVVVVVFILFVFHAWSSCFIFYIFGASCMVIMLQFSNYNFVLASGLKLT